MQPPCDALRTQVTPPYADRRRTPSRHPKTPCAQLRPAKTDLLPLFDAVLSRSPRDRLHWCTQTAPATPRPNTALYTLMVGVCSEARNGGVPLRDPRAEAGDGTLWGKWRASMRVDVVNRRLICGVLEHWEQRVLRRIAADPAFNALLRRCAPQNRRPRREILNARPPAVAHVLVHLERTESEGRDEDR